jgi:hypothetical protein
MKRHLISIAVEENTILPATIEVRALPPRQHSVSGVIDSVDWTSRRISLTSANGTRRLVLAWTDRTRFTKSAGCEQCSLAVGRAVSIYYRQELGRNVLREVSAKGGTCQQGQP